MVFISNTGTGDGIIYKFTKLMSTDEEEKGNDDDDDNVVPPTNNRLSPELWVRVFNNLDRNDIDNCRLVCTGWCQIVKSNRRRLPARVIDRVILSSKRLFSIIVASGSVVKRYQYRKYFNAESMRAALNDPKRHMLVETYRRRPAVSSKCYHLDHVHSLAVSAKTQNPNQVDDEAYWREQQQRDGEELKQFGIGMSMREVLRLPAPPASLKTRYKLATPQSMFFQKLNDLLRGHSVVRQWHFQSFTLSNAFVSRLLHQVRPIQAISGPIRLTRVRLMRSKLSQSASEFLFRALLHDSFAGQLQVGGDRAQPLTIGGGQAADEGEGDEADQADNGI